jgi:hypothetical protein
VNRISLCAIVILVGGILTGIANVAHAAQSYDNCTGFITSLPAVITTPGTLCFKQDLVTAMTAGNAITINASNVTLDCNDFKLGGLGAGVGTHAMGVNASQRFNITVRHCNIRGFKNGVNLVGQPGGGHVVEDNRLDGNTSIGIVVNGDGSVIRRNLVSDTGGSTVQPGVAIGIDTSLGVDVLDNSVSGVTPTANASGDGWAYGIYLFHPIDTRIQGNIVRGMIPVGTGVARGILANESNQISVRSNDVFNHAAGAWDTGIECDGASGSDSSRDNVISGFNVPVAFCISNGDVALP